VSRAQRIILCVVTAPDSFSDAADLQMGQAELDLWLINADHGQTRMTQTCVIREFPDDRIFSAMSQN
jgi:hypothetical protein